MNNSYICENIDDVKYLFEQFIELNSIYEDYTSFVNDFIDYNIIIFYEDGGKWFWDDRYDTEQIYNYIKIKNLTRNEKLKRILEL